MVIRTTAAICGLLTLAGCATKWQHTAMTDPVAVQRQLTIDDGYCTMVSAGSLPMPQVVIPAPLPAPTTSNIAMTGTAVNPATGGTTTTNSRGTVTTAPAPSFGAGFANGFASGANLGATLAAGLAQEKIHTACMYAKGWTDIPGQAAMQKTALVARPGVAPKPVSFTQIYATPQEEWGVDTAEFLNIYPTYREQPHFDRLNENVKRIARASPQLSGPQVLLAARDALVQAGQAPIEAQARGIAQLSYAGAAAGKGLDQAGMGLFYSKGDATIAADAKRAAYWAQKSAAAGHPMGRIGYGVLMFSGWGVPQDHVDAYRWVQPIAATDANAQEILARFEADMTPDELKQVR